MAQAQFKGPLLVLRKDVCTACYVVYDLIERPPKHLQCGHYFCLLCLQCMRKENVILCFICETPTPFPEHLELLPNQTGRSLTRRNPDAISKPVTHGTGDHQRFPVQSMTAHLSAQTSAEDAGTLASNYVERRVWKHQPSDESIHSATTTDEEEHRAEILGEPSGPSRELLFGLVLPHHDEPNVLWSDRANTANGWNDAFCEPSDSDHASSTVESSQESVRDGGAEGVLCGPPRSIVPSRSSNASSNPSNSFQVNRIPQEFVDLIEKLKDASRNSNDDGWVFMWYLQEEAKTIHRNLLELMLNQRETAPRSDFDDQSSRFGRNIIDHIKDVLGKLQRGENNSTVESLIPELCAVLMYQRYKTFLVEKSRVGQSIRVLIPPSIPEGIKNFIVNGNFTVYFTPVDGVQTHIEKIDIPPFSQDSETEKGCGIRREIQKKGMKNERNIVANLNKAELKVSEPLHHFATRNMANIYYMDFKISGRHAGRVVIETHPSLTPLMSANFAVLCSGTRRTSYRGCTVFQTWYGQSIITGDNETNTGNGGRSVLNDEFFVPDEASIPAERGAVGMRRLARNPANQKGKVSSQFRILLNNQPRITGIFGHVVSGIDVVDKIAKLDDGNGNPRKRVIIYECGKLDF